MTRGTRTAVVLLFSVGTATVASLSVYRATSAPAPAATKDAGHRVVIATRPLPLGHEVKAEDVRSIVWPGDAQIAGAFTDVSSVVGRGVVIAALEHEPLTEGKLAPRDAGAGLPPAIPWGMRAISVKVNEVIGVAGFVVPGTRVDVLATVRGAHNEPVTRVMVSDVDVLTAGTRYDQGGTREVKPIAATVVTLAVTPDDAERIALAATEGQIVLALRNPLDRHPTTTQGVRLGALAGTPDPAPAPPPRVHRAAQRVAAPPVAVAAASPRYVVEAIRAAKRSEEVVR